MNTKRSYFFSFYINLSVSLCFYLISPVAYSGSVDRAGNSNAGSANLSNNKRVRTAERTLASNSTGSSIPQYITNSSYQNQALQAMGVILKFHHWPDEQEKTLILQKIETANLKLKRESSLFKTWVFEWEERKSAKIAKQVCSSLPSQLSSLDYCEPDYIHAPAFFPRRSAPPVESPPTSEDSGGSKQEDSSVSNNNQQQSQQIRRDNNVVSRLRRLISRLFGGSGTGGGTSSSTDGGGATDSGATDSGATDSGATDSGATDSGATDSGATDSGATDSGATDSGATDSGATDSGATDSGATDSGATDSGATDSGATDSGATDSGATDSGATDSGATDSGATDSGATDSGATDSGATDSGATDSGATDSGATDSGATDSGATDSGATDSGATDSGATDGGNDLTTGDLVSCNIITEQAFSNGVKLPKYWAQEMIGADLMKEEIVANTPDLPADKHLVSVVDIPTASEGVTPHATMVKNIVSDDGKHSVLPDLGSHMDVGDGGRTSNYGPIAEALLNRCENDKNNLEQCKLQKLPAFINHSVTWYESQSVFNAFKSLSPPSILVVSAGNTHPDGVYECPAECSVDTPNVECNECASVKIVGGTQCTALVLNPYTCPKATLDSKKEEAAGAAAADGEGGFDAIIVGSMNPAGRRSSFSQIGSGVHIVAPSDEYMASADDNGNYKQFSGTSGATPLVTGSLAGFEWLGGYHPTSAEAKILLEKTAIPTWDSETQDPQTNGVGMVNAYKLAMVAKKIKTACGTDAACFSRMIQDSDTYSFPHDTGLLNAVNQAFPKCNNVNCHQDPSVTTCSSQSAAFKRLRKAAFLDPSNQELWKILSCIYNANGFDSIARGAIKTYMASSWQYGQQMLIEPCNTNADCTIVPKCEGNQESFKNTEQYPHDFISMNVLVTEFYYASQCFGTPCNNKCRCSNDETVLTHDESGEVITSTQYQSQCVNNRKREKRCKLILPNTLQPTTLKSLPPVNDIEADISSSKEKEEIGTKSVQ